MKRRSFLIASAVGAVSTLGGSIARAVTKPSNSFIKVSTLKTGQPVLVKATFKGKPRNLLVTMLSANKFSVLDATCTHQGCRVDVLDKGLECPCHKSTFDPKNGAVLGGIAPAPLATVKFTVKSGYLCFM